MIDPWVSLGVATAGIAYRILLMTGNHTLLPRQCPAVILALALSSGAQLEAQTVSCAPNDSFATHLLDIARELVTPRDTNPISLRFRAKLGLSAVPDSEVVLVAVDSVCAVAAAAVKASLGPGKPTPEVEMVVVRLGTTGYVVLDRRDVYEINLFHVFGSTWIYKATVTLEG
jgi:hypothetical protein